MDAPGLAGFGFRHLSSPIPFIADLKLPITVFTTASNVSTKSTSTENKNLLICLSGNVKNTMSKIEGRLADEGIYEATTYY
ncbi:hypothetical protein CUMW_133010 [Citrus unshiu]|nr:hypothetical protein CUMW_133010 [Citrus unshiu]